MEQKEGAFLAYLEKMDFLKHPEYITPLETIVNNASDFSSILENTTCLHIFDLFEYGAISDDLYTQWKIWNTSN